MSKKQRYSVDFSPETVEILDNLRKRLGKNSTADVVRLAVQTLNYLETQRADGYTVNIVMRKDGEQAVKHEKEVVFLGG